jgi:hypothetical protein
VLVVFFDPLLVSRTFFDRDMGVYFFPIEKQVHQAWASGHLPLWWENVSGGRPLLPNPNAGVFYPLRLLGVLLPFGLFFKLFPILHLILAAWGMYFLALRLGATRSGAACSAVVLVFSGPVIAEVVLVALLPGLVMLLWSWWALIGLGERPTQRRAALLAAIVGVGLLSLEPFALVLFGIVSVVWIALEVAPENRRRTALLWVEANVLAAVVAAVQLVPTFLYVGETDRALGGLKSVEAYQWSLHPIRLIEYLVPYPFGATGTEIASQVWGGRFFDFRPSGYFPTLFMGAFAAIALIQAVRRKGPHRRTLAVLIVLSILLAAAPLLIHGWLVWARAPVPLRFTEKFAVGAVIAAAILAGQLFDETVRAARWPRWPLFLAFALLAGSALAAIFRVRIGPQILHWTQGNIGSLPALEAGLPSVPLAAALHLFGALAILILLADWGRREWARVAAVVLVAAEIFPATRNLAPSSPEALVETPPPAARALSHLDPGRRFCLFDLCDYAIKPEPVQSRPQYERQLWRSMAIVSFATWGQPGIFNMDPDVSDLYRMGALRRLFFWHLAREKSARDRLVPFLGSLSAGYLLRLQSEPPWPGTSPAARVGPLALDRIDGAVARMRLATRWVEVRDGGQAWNRMASGGDPPEVAILETGRSSSGEARPGTLRVIRSSSSQFDVETDSPDPSWLAVTRAFWRWREVSIDGIPAACVPQRFALSAVAVPAGRHRVVWKEKVPGGAAGGALTAAGFLLLALLSRIES